MIEIKPVNPLETLKGVLELVDQEVIELDNVGPWAVGILEGDQSGFDWSEGLELARDGGLDELRALLTLVNKALTL